MATIDGSGNLTAIAIRNPGVYSSVVGLTATLSGGGKNTTSATTVITTAANTSGGLTKQGAGTTTLSGANTYAGGTTIKAGTLNISTTDGANGAAAQLGVVPSSATPGNIVINGGTLNFSAAATLSGNRGIALGPTSGSGSGTINAATGTPVINGIIADNGGTGALIKTGAGSLGCILTLSLISWAGGTPALLCRRRCRQHRTARPACPGEGEILRFTQG